MRIGKLYQIALSVRDLDASIEFYGKKLGLPLIRRFDEPVKLAFFDVGDVRLMLEEGDGESVFYLKVQNLKETLEALRRIGVDMAGGPHAIYSDSDGYFGPAGETEWMAFVKDPSGNLIGLIERRRNP